MREYLATCDRFFLDNPSGGARIAWELARLVARTGSTTYLLAGSLEGDGPPGSSVVDGITVIRYRVPQSHPLDPRRLARHTAAARAALERFAARVQWDVIHAHMPIGAAAAFPVASAHTRRLYTVHSAVALEQSVGWRDGTLAGWLKRTGGLPWLRRVERSALRQAHAIHALSRFTLECLRREHPSFDTSKAVRIPWWVEPTSTITADRPTLRRRLGWPVDRQVVFTLRRLTARMGLTDLLDAVASVKDSTGFVTVIGGGGPERVALEQRVDDLGLRDRVIFMGRMSEDDVRHAYAAADLFVLPTRSLEGFGIIVLEALAAGCPVIATSAGAIPEILSDCLPEALFAPGDVAALASLLRRFAHGKLALPPASHLRSFVQARYNVMELRQRYLQFICGEDLPAEQSNDQRVTRGSTRLAAGA
jgi:glycosyltransferase involved in cell wall biosynthesis